MAAARRRCGCGVKGTSVEKRGMLPLDRYLIIKRKVVYFSKWSPFGKLQEINLEAAGVKRC